MNTSANLHSWSFFLSLTLKSIDNEGKKAAVRFAEAVDDNNSLTTLKLVDTDEIGLENLEQWGFAPLLQVLQSNHIRIKGKQKELTNDRTLKLEIY